MSSGRRVCCLVRAVTDTYTHARPQLSDSFSKCRGPVARAGIRCRDRFNPSAWEVNSMLVAGVDSSTQSTKVVLCRAEDGTVVARGSAPHPPGTECDPAAWWSALEQAGAGLLSRADAIAVAAQQHGMVVVDDTGAVIRPALLWNDLRSAGAAEQLIA